MSKRVPSCFETILISGLLCGITLGQVDLAARFAARRFEWHEVYQALLIPAAVFLILFLIGGVLSYPFAARRHPHLVRRGSVLLSLTVLLMVSAVLGAAYTGALFMRGKFTSQSAAVLSAAGVALLVGIFMHLAVLRTLNRAIESYFVFISFFVIVSLLYDVLTIGALPRMATKAVSGAVRPNIILITLDTVRPDRLPPWGAPRNTGPNLKAIADGGAVFERTISTSSWTLPAHASIFTGLYPHAHGATSFREQLPGAEVTLAELLGAAGYRTAGFIGGAYMKRKYGMAQGFEFYRDRLDLFESAHTFNFFSIERIFARFSPGFARALLRNDGERSAEEINGDLFEWLKHAKSAPFFAFVNYFDAHHPYTRGANYRAEFGIAPRSDEGALQDRVENLYYAPQERYAPQGIPAPDLEFLLGAYDSEIRSMDEAIGALVAELGRLNLSHNTAIIITGDHGEEFFEHGGTTHRLTLYEEVVRVPLVMSWPGKIAPQRIAERTSLIDIFPTVLELAQLSPVEGMPGRSLLPALAGGTIEARALLAELYPKFGDLEVRALYLGEMKYIEVRNPRGRVQPGLFDLKLDPFERRSLAGTDLELTTALASGLSAFPRARP